MDEMEGRKSAGSKVACPHLFLEVGGAYGRAVWYTSHREGPRVVDVSVACVEMLSALLSEPDRPS